MSDMQQTRDAELGANASMQDRSTGREGAAQSDRNQGMGNTSMSNGGQQSASLGDVQQQAGALITNAREQAVGQVASQKAQLARTLGVLAGALQQAGQQVREQEPGPVADYVDAAANQVARLSTTLEEQDFPQLLQTVKQFGQRQPGLFLATVAALGFAGVRIMKSGSGTSSGESRSTSSWSGSTSPDEGGYQGNYWDSSIRPEWQSTGASASGADRMVEQSWSGGYPGTGGAEPQ